METTRKGQEHEHNKSPVLACCRRCEEEVGGQGQEQRPTSFCEGPQMPH